MELAVLVALWSSLRVFAFPRAKLAEILCCSRRDIGKEFYLDTTQ
jgi:hypothetical protein